MTGALFFEELFQPGTATATGWYPVHTCSSKADVQFSDLIILINAGYTGVLLFGRTIKYCVTNIRHKAEVSNLTQYFILQNSRVSYRQYFTVS